jgi:hypothetical protein
LSVNQDLSNNYESFHGLQVVGFTGGADRDRTDDLLNAMRETHVDFKGKFKDIKGLIATECY